MRILVVEDEKEIADGVQAILKQNGYESDAVYDGDMGLEYIRTDITLDQTTYKLAHEEKSIKLSNKEYQFMEYLMINKGIILSHDTIATKVWGFDDEADYNNIAVYVSFLRKKLKFIGAKAAIVTKKEVGYSLEEHDGKKSS